MDFTTNYSTGNEIVDQVGKMSFTGNITPAAWYQTIRYPNGKPNINAITILADIVYWYRPAEKRDEATGQLLGMRKKFRDDLLQRSYEKISEQYGLTKTQVISAVKALEEIGVVRREFKNLRIAGQCVNNVLYLKLIPEVLFSLTYPDKGERGSMPDYNEGGNSFKIGDMPVSNGGGVNSESGMPSVYNEGGHNSEISTNTENTKEILTENSVETIHHIYQNEGDAEKVFPNDESERKGIVMDKMMDMMDAHRNILQENICYESLLQEHPMEQNEIKEILELLTETVAVPREKVKIAGAEYPYNFVKGKLLKLDHEHINYVLECLRNNTTKIRNIKAYLLAALFNAPNTMDNYYRAEVNHDMKGGF